MAGFSLSQHNENGPNLPLETTTMPRHSFPEPVTRALRNILCP